MADDGGKQHKPDFRTAVEDVKAMATVLAMEAESVLRRRPAKALGLLVVLLVVVVALLHWYIGPGNAGERNDFILTLAQIMGGAALLLGLYFTWRTLQVNREGQITERFSRAIDQLGATDGEGNKLVELRIGGIYALERISKETEEYYGPIMEILSAYVRHYAWRPPEAEEKHTIVRRLDPDIAAIMAVIRRRSRPHAIGEDESPLGLDNCDLRFAGLDGAHLEGASFMRAYMQGASLAGAHLEGANLIGTHLRGAILMGTHLEGALLLGTNLAEANLFGCTGLTQEGLDNAIGDEKTRLPAGLVRPAAWSQSIDDQLERLKKLQPPSALRERMIAGVEKEMVKRMMHRIIEEAFRGL